MREARERAGERVELSDDVIAAIGKPSKEVGEVILALRCRSSVSAAARATRSSPTSPTRASAPTASACITRIMCRRAANAVQTRTHNHRDDTRARARDGREQGNRSGVRRGLRGGRARRRRALPSRRARSASHTRPRSRSRRQRYNRPSGPRHAGAKASAFFTRAGTSTMSSSIMASGRKPRSTS